jgi:hypothetical protein
VGRAIVSFRDYSGSVPPELIASVAGWAAPGSEEHRVRCEPEVQRRILQGISRLGLNPRRVCITLLHNLLEFLIVLGVRRAILIRMGKLDEASPGSDSHLAKTVKHR